MILVITGGTGSLGKAVLNHQDILKNHGITKIKILSRDEQKQVSLMRKYHGEIPLKCFLADVTDKERMEFGLNDADYVIHAAAQKHVDKFELDVKTGFKTNILGTQNVSDAFMKSRNAKSAIFVSTDKAVSPITSYGVSKLAAEHLWLWHNCYQPKVKFGICRYGNVYGSKGSVVETWTENAKKGKALPLTNMQATRFFISMREAARFVLESLFKNEKKIHIPEMKAASMVNVARTIWNYWNIPDLAYIEKIEMRGNEKIHEVLTLDGVSSENCEKFTEEELHTMYKDWFKEQ